MLAETVFLSGGSKGGAGGGGGGEGDGGVLFPF